MNASERATAMQPLEDGHMEEEPWQKRVVCDPEIMGGEPCIKGTRIPISIIVASLADASIEELLKEYPQLTREDVRAALWFASEASHNTLVA
ncbi:MAG: DUF433 domain-containing protein [Planctomycetota bacterium]